MSERAGTVRVLGALLAVAVAGLVALSAVLAGANRDLDAAEALLADRDRVARVAGELTEALFTFDSDDPDANRDRVLDLATGNLEEEYDLAFEGSVGAALSEVGTSASVVVTDVFVGDVGDDTARAVTVMNLELRTGDSVQRTFDNHLVLTLVRTTTGWKVDRVVTVGTDSGPRVDGADPSS